MRRERTSGEVRGVGEGAPLGLGLRYCTSQQDQHQWGCSARTSRAEDCSSAVDTPLQEGWGGREMPSDMLDTLLMTSGV